jgi:cytochrome c oxidase subunit 2
VASRLFDLYMPVFWVAVVVFVLVEAAIIYVLVRFRRRPEQTELPPQTHGNTRLELAWTIAPAIILGIVAIPTVDTLVDLSRTPDNALQVKAIAHQWWWEFQYEDGQVITGGEMHIPVGRPVEVTVESGDVIHNFWVPNLAGKIYAIPNHTNKMWLNAREPGTYYGQCAEFCGISHAWMKFAAKAESQEDFERWLASERGRTPPTGLAAQGEQTFLGLACIGCHAVAGTTAQGRTGPNLTNFGNRDRFAGWYLENNDENLRRWLKNPQAVKPGAKMPNLNLSDEQVDQLVAYLNSLTYK